MDIPNQTENTNKSSEKKINVMALVCYLGPLFLIPVLNKKSDEFVRFHIKQGMVLFLGEVLTSVIITLMPAFWMLLNFVNLGWLILSIVGIMNVVNNEKKELPLIGNLAEKFKF